MARPDLSYLKNVALFLSGVPLGLLTGLTAVSASVFGVSAVRRLLGLRPARALAVGLSLAFFAAAAGILSYAQQGAVWVGLALLLFAFQTFGALGAERLLSKMPQLEAWNLIWGGLVILGGAAMVAQGIGILPWAAAVDASASHPPAFYLLAALLAAAVGLVSRVIGLGGVLLVPAAIYGLDLPPETAQGTALVVLVLAGLPALLVHVQRGEVDTQAATWLSAGAILGALTGALLSVTRFTDHAHVLLFGLLLIILGLRMLRRTEVQLNAAT